MVTGDSMEGPMNEENSKSAQGREASSEPLTMRAVLAIADVRRLWIAHVISAFGDFLALFAVISMLTFRLGATPHQVTNLQIAYLLPTAVLGILSGVLVDRWPLKSTMVFSDLIRASLCIVLLFAGRLGYFYLILAAISVLSSVFSPAQGILIRTLVPRHGLRSAQALMQQVLFGVRIVGPPLAVAVFKVLGPRWCYVADAVSFLISAALMSSIAVPRKLSSSTEPQVVAESTIVGSVAGEPLPRPSGPLQSVVSDMKVGLSFIFRHVDLSFVVTALAAGMFVLGCFGPLLAVYVRDTLHGASGAYSVASLAIGLGMFAGVNMLNTAGKGLSDRFLVYTGLLGIAVGLVSLTALPYLWATVAGNLVIGVAVSAIVVPANTLIQQETPIDLMGRVGSSTMSVVFSAQIIGLLLSGLLSDRFGVRRVFVICAGILLLLSLVFRLLHRKPKAVALAAGKPGSPALTS